MATPMGFEPTISTVTGWHVSPLHHGAALMRNPTERTHVPQKSINMMSTMSSYLLLIFEQTNN